MYNIALSVLIFSIVMHGLIISFESYILSLMGAMLYFALRVFLFAIILPCSIYVYIQNQKQPPLMTDIKELYASIFGGISLFDAAAKGNLKRVKALVEKGADVNQIDDDGNSPLMKAAQVIKIKEGNCILDGDDLVLVRDGQHLEIIKFLLEKGANINLPDPHGCTPLGIAASYGNVDLVKFLIEKRADINQADDGGETPLIKATQFIQLDEGNWIIALTVLGINDIVPHESNLEIIQELLKKGADINQARSDGVTPLHSASFWGNLNIAKLLIEKGADIHKIDEHGYTPLIEAVHKDRPESLGVVELLVQKGADINHQDFDGQTPLYIAALSERLDIVKFLLEKGADINQAQIDAYKKTSNFIEHYAEHVEIARVALEKGNINQVYQDGTTPLWHAAYSGNLEFVKTLLEKGADINHVASDGTTPLFVAAQETHLDVVKFLFEKGANIIIPEDTDE